MAGHQRVSVIGYLAKDPEIKSFEWGMVCNLTIPTSETWKDKSSGEKKEKTEWHKIVIKNNDGMIEKFIRPYVKKGCMVSIEGKLETRKYDKDGVTHYVTEIIVKSFDGSFTLHSSPKSSADEKPDHKGFDHQGDVGGAQTKAVDNFVDDEIPF